MSANNQPVAFTEEMLPIHKASKKDDRPQERPIPDPIGTALGASFYIADKTFNELRYPAFERSGKLIPMDKFIFKRFYPEKKVIVELINIDSDKVRKEVRLKCEALLEYNKANEGSEIGYLPLLAFQKVSMTTFKEVCEGKIFNLPERNPQLERVQQKAVFITHGNGDGEQ
jgi:hypothetical protein